MYLCSYIKIVWFTLYAKAFKITKKIDMKLRYYFQNAVQWKLGRSSQTEYALYSKCYNLNMLYIYLSTRSPKEYSMYAGSKYRLYSK